VGFAGSFTTETVQRCDGRKLQEPGLCWRQVIRKFFEYEGIPCGEIFSHTPDHIRSNDTPTGLEASESCLCKEVFIRHSSLSLPFRTHSGHQSDEYEVYEEKLFKCRDCGKSLLLPDSLNGM
jgi:hypothetical protein